MDEEFIIEMLMTSCVDLIHLSRVVSLRVAIWMQLIRDERPRLSHLQTLKEIHINIEILCTILDTIAMFLASSYTR